MIAVSDSLGRQNLERVELVWKRKESMVLDINQSYTIRSCVAVGNERIRYVRWAHFDVPIDQGAAQPRRWICWRRKGAAIQPKISPRKRQLKGPTRRHGFFFWREWGDREFCELLLLSNMIKNGFTTEAIFLQSSWSFQRPL